MQYTVNQESHRLLPVSNTQKLPRPPKQDLGGILQSVDAGGKQAFHYVSPKSQKGTGIEKRETPKNGILTHRGDPRVTQGNPRKVALDVPLLNGLKEKSRNVLTKATKASIPPQHGHILMASEDHTFDSSPCSSPLGNTGGAAEFLSALFTSVPRTGMGSVPIYLWKAGAIHVLKSLRGSLGIGTTAKQQSLRLGLCRTFLRVGAMHGTGSPSFSAPVPKQNAGHNLNMHLEGGPHETQGKAEGSLETKVKTCPLHIIEHSKRNISWRIICAVMCMVYTVVCIW